MGRPTKDRGRRGENVAGRRDRADGQGQLRPLARRFVEDVSGCRDRGRGRRQSRRFARRRRAARRARAVSELRAHAAGTEAGHRGDRPALDRCAPRDGTGHGGSACFDLHGEANGANAGRMRPHDRCLRSRARANIGGLQHAVLPGARLCPGPTERGHHRRYPGVARSSAKRTVARAAKT